MLLREEIDKAIGAHGLWKGRLRAGIATGKIEPEVSVILQDNQCAFGKWLYGDTITADERSHPHYKNIRELHAEFHKTAAQVAELALAGKTKEAEALMGIGGHYAQISAKLTAAMMEWKQGLG